MNEALPTRCTLGEALIYQIALTIEDGVLAFHGFGSPLVQLALHLAKPFDFHALAEAVEKVACA